MYKLLLIVFKSLNNLAQEYIICLLKPYIPSRMLRSKKLSLLCKPRSKHLWGDRPFSIAAPRLWMLYRLIPKKVLLWPISRDLLKMDMPISTCIFFTFNWLTLTSEIHFVKFHPEVASCLLSRGKRKYAPLGMRLLWKYINYFLVYHLTSHFLLYLQNYKEFWSQNFGFAIRKIWAFIWYQKIYHFRLSPGGWECDRHKVL